MVRHTSRLGSELLQKSGHFNDDIQISALDAFYEMDGRRIRYIKEVSGFGIEEKMSEISREVGKLIRRFWWMRNLIREDRHG